MSQDGIAIVGMDVRFPGAGDVDAFWRNLRAGVESTTFFSEQELRAAGVAPALLADPRYVKANGVLAGAEDFDAEFFGMNPREAEITDPQHRVLLELAWTALERAGCDAARHPGRIGVFAGAGLSSYLLRNLAPNRALVESAGELALLLGNNKDFAPTRISYKLNLRGPSMAVNSACSTSLVAAHLACQSLLDFHCDLALAGGVSVQVPQAQGYLHQEGGIGSPDGRCRAFDARAGGTVSGNGAGLVVLKRLADALAAGDTIHAVIRGSAVNNDGSAKVGFTAPSVEGQAQVIAEAQAVAGVEPRDISYVEAHGTGTELGDPIEVAALTEVFRARTAEKGFCRLGSVKSNFGHLDEAAGIAGLVKTVLALVHRELPPSLHFTEANPKIDFAGGPFVVNSRLSPWPARDGAPRRAGVSSFGIGGTNAHLILEEAPAFAEASAGGARLLAPAAAGDAHLLVLSARTPAALERMAENLAGHLEADPDRGLADVAYTLAVGRREFEWRRFVVAGTAREAAALLRGGAGRPEAGPARLLEAGRAWAEGGAADWTSFYAGQGRRRVPLPTYPFERRRHWIEAPAFAEASAGGARLLVLSARKRSNLADWFYQPSWRQAARPAVALAEAGAGVRTILWLGEAGPAGGAVECLRAAGHGVTVVADFSRVATRAACASLLAGGAAPASAKTSAGLASAEAAASQGARYTDVVHAWSVRPLDPAEDFDRAQALGYASVLGLVQALAQTGLTAGLRLSVVASHVADVTGDEPLAPARATLLGLIQVAAQEFPGLACRAIDVTGASPEKVGAQLAAEIVAGVSDGMVAFRGARRWIRSYEPLALDAPAGAGRLRPRGTYLITGGLGGVGLIVAEYLARTVQARLVLVSRRGAQEPAAADRGREPTRAGAADPADPAAEARYAAFTREIDALASLLAGRYLAAAGSDLGPGTRVPLAALRQKLGVQRPFEKCLDYLVGILAADGYLVREGEDLVWQRTPGDASQAVAALAASYPEFRGIVGLLDHCTARYGEALSGRVPAIGILYPDGPLELLAKAGGEILPHTDKDARIARLRELVDRTIADAGGRRIRILEVGVGDGLLAGQIAPGLKGRNVEYVATDLGRAFVVKAEKAAAAAGLDFVSFGVLDISRDAAAQGFAPGSFDFVVALDVVHATPKAAGTLGHLRALLRPGGTLGLIEKVRDERWVNLVWGLAEGWWCFADAEVRRRVPLLPAESWERLLRQLDFGGVEVHPREPAAREAADYALLTARKAGEPASGRRAAVRRLETLGAEVMVEEADVADAGQMRAALARAEARFGPLHGAVHAAGLTAGPAVFNLLPDATPEQAAALFRPKAAGAEVLAAALAGRSLDFCVLISSNASVLGGLGLAAYAASNAYLDLLAAEQRRRGAGAWTSTNWDGWPTEGTRASELRVQTSIDQFAMTRAEAEAAFASVLAAPVAQVAVSSGDLQARLRRWTAPKAERSEAPASGRPESPPPPSLHARPAKAAAYVAPRTETERIVAALWSELLGIDQVGAEDNFFDLEGDSLLGTQLIARLGRDLGIALSVGVVFEAPTVAELAGRIDRDRAAQGPAKVASTIPADSPAEEEGTL